ncbi:MAG: redox-sensing transcriptional repressor Rex [Armatimonadota bacterium]
MAENEKIPTPTLERLAMYLRVLTNLMNTGVRTVSSTHMEEHTGVNAAQFRKDLSFFGEFGRPGVGYNVESLHARIKEILKLHQPQRVLLVGAGNLGRALVGYPALAAEDFHIVAVFDNNPAKVGSELMHLTIDHVDSLVERNRTLGARIGIIAVPAYAAQQVAEQLVEADVLAILNFAPVVLRLPPQVTVRNVDFVQELAVLSFYLPDQWA